MYRYTVHTYVYGYDDSICNQIKKRPNEQIMVTNCVGHGSVIPLQSTPSYHYPNSCLRFRFIHKQFETLRDKWYMVIYKPTNLARHK